MRTRMLQFFGCVCLLCALCACAVVPEPAAAVETPFPEPTPMQPVEETLATSTPVMPVQFDLPTPVPTVIATPEPLPPLSGIVIGLDPGHQRQADHGLEQVAPGGTEYKAKCSTGTRGTVSNVYEYEVTLSVALKLKALLEAQGAKVVITRTGHDVHLSNRQRADFMNENEVDLAVRLHCNGVDDPAVRGAFMLVPTRERTEHFTENVQAATAIIEHYCAVTGIEMRKNNGITYRDNQTGFNWCTRPIVCIEMGHMSNENEDLLLTNEQFQDKMAVGIFDGILAYFHPDGNEGGGN